MRIGDIEYTRVQTLDVAVGGVSVVADIGFALGIKVRAFLTGIHCFPSAASAASSGTLALFENSQSIAAGLTRGALRADSRAIPVYTDDFALATNGMGLVLPHDNLFWKVLQPDVRLHLVSSVHLAEMQFVMRYRFAELTDDEIVEIAAQRAQG